MVVINIINGVLLYRLLRADIWSTEGSGKRKRGEDISGEGLNDKSDIAEKNETDNGLAGSMHVNGLRLRDNVNHIMKHVVQTNVHS